jgi:hypothetical protein
MPRNLFHRPKDAPVVDAATPKLFLGHRQALREERIGFEELLHFHFLR